MLPLFANPAGLWALLGIPAILAIHFLQQRARVARTSTWFLIEKLAPDSARGRTWDRLRTSRTLWLQLAAFVLAAWILGEPRWVRAESAQTVVIVFDASASMDAFRAPALAAAERELNLAEGMAARTTWVVMTSDPRQPALYRGTERLAAAGALSRWQPEAGRHDLAPALRLARTLAGAAGRTLLITDSRSKAPPDQRTVGVGQPIENVGLTGAVVKREAGGAVWRALVQNHANAPQRRTWHAEIGSNQSPAQPIELPANGLTEISAPFPTGADRLTLVLSADGFLADNRLPIIVPEPKPLTVAVEGSDDAAQFFRKLAAEVPGVTVSEQNPLAKLRVARLAAAEVANERRGGMFWPPADRRAEAPLLTDAVTPERHALVAGLNWQGWFGSGPYGYAPAPQDVALLWHGRWPLIFLRTRAVETTNATEKFPEQRQLMLAFDWATSNAARLPSTVLLARRFLESERDAQNAPYAANFDCGSLVPLTGMPVEGVLTVEFEPAAAAASGVKSPPSVVPPAERTELRAPGRAGFFTVRQGNEVAVRGAAQFADPRQGDFSAAESFFVEARDARAVAIERNTTADPFVLVWLTLLAAVVLASWWMRSGAKGSRPKNVGATKKADRNELAPASS